MVYIENQRPPVTSQSMESDAIKFCVHPVRYFPWGWILHFDGGKPFSQCVCA